MKERRKRDRITKQPKQKDAGGKQQRKEGRKRRNNDSKKGKKTG